MGEAGGAPTTGAQPLVVTARPLRTGRIANISAAVVIVIFVVIAIVEPKYSAGASFGWKDQVFTGILGLIIAAGLHLPARPRLRADADAIRFRGYAGNWREVRWSDVVAVEFPSKVRFARIVFPGDESFALYAVQRADREDAVRAMRGLRALFEQTHGA